MQGSIRLAAVLGAILFSGTFGLAAQAGSSSQAKNPIRNFQVVEEGVYRGGRPESAGMEYLKAMGIRTIINLENEEKAVDREMRQAQALGIRELSFPMGYFKVKTKTVNAVLEALADRSLRPVYIHCAAGKDRTGVVLGVKRVEHDGWSPKAAYREMKKYGFHSIYFWMSRYFKKRTGYDD